MSELIDRQALIKQLKDENIPFNADINEIINIQPIAFDVANIVEKLEEREKYLEKEMKENHENGYQIGEARAMNERVAIRYAINIVKQEINNEENNT